MSWLNSLKNKSNHGLYIKRLSLMSPGLYHYEWREKENRSRIHLRIDIDGKAVLFINANQIVHLNPTAALMTRFALEGIPDLDAIHAIQSQYQVSQEQAEADYTNYKFQLQELIWQNGICPIHDMEIEVDLPFSSHPSAPYRMDLALTYRCNNDCAHCYNARPRDYPEISTDDWKAVLDRLWRLGIPHVVFTGGEPTLRTDLPELISHARFTGMITGLNTNGRRLADATFINQLVEAGLDHVQITFESHNPVIHDNMVRLKGAWKQTVAGLKKSLDCPLHVMTNTTMLRENSPYLLETLDYLATLGVPTIGLNALIYAGHGMDVSTGLHESELNSLLDPARKRIEKHHQRLIWYTPTEYCHFDPVQLDLGVKGCTAALYNMCIEPDGGVIPCQSYYHQLGMILNDPWDSIWSHPLSISLRERQHVSQRCQECLVLNECGGGCPLKPVQPK